jgi:bloom syndrome protein
VKMSLQVHEGVAAMPKRRQTTKKDTTKSKTSKVPPSTNISSPPTRGGRQKKGKAAASAPADDEDDEDDIDAADLHASGYARDGFVVDDGDWDDEDAFEPLPLHRQQQSKGQSRAVGPPISQDLRLEDLPEWHQDMVQFFVVEAKGMEERLRNQKGMRKPLFSEKDFREMAINWTTSLDQMRRIKGIDADKVQKFGDQFLPLIQNYHRQYRDMTQQARRSGETEIVDLISDDDDDDRYVGLGAEEADEVDEDEEEAFEQSRFFDTSADCPRGGPSAAPPIREWRDAFSHLSQPQPPSRNTTSTRGKGTARGGKRPYTRRASGYVARKAHGGVAKRKASAGSGKRASGGSSKSGTSFFGKGSRGGGAGGRSVGRGGGGSIGLMPM